MSALSASERGTLTQTAIATLNDPNATTDQKVAALISLLQGRGLL